MKKIFLWLMVLMLLTPICNVQAMTAPPLATVINPETGERKVVKVNDPHAFDGGFVLELIFFDEDALGYTVVTNYKTTVNIPMSISQDYVPVSSLTTKDDHVLTIDDVDKVFLVIESGKRKEEIVLCTSLNSTTVRWTDCTRGLAFYGKSLASVQDNIETHSSGSTVTMSNTHQVYDQFINKDDDQTIGGAKTFTGTTTFSLIPTTATTTPTLDEQVAVKKYVDDVISAGAPDGTESVKGINELATQLEMASSTIQGSTATNLVLQSQYATSSAPASGLYLPVTENDGNLNQGFLDLTENWGFTGTITNEGYAISNGFGGDGSDGALNVTSGTTTLDASDSNILVKNYTSINISASAVLDMSNSATSGTLLILKSRGDCTIDGKIDLKGNGSDPGTTGYGLFVEADDIFGDDGAGAASSTSVNIITSKGKYVTPDENRLYQRYIVLSTGGGGGDGAAGAGAGSGAGGDGGNGGGSFILECGGALDFSATGEINVNGEDGSPGVVGATFASGGGGGGGSAGMALGLYNSLTDNSGTVNAKGGAGGDGADGPNGSSNSRDGGGGGQGGGSYSYSGASGGQGGTDPVHPNGTVGLPATSSEGAGGGGGGSDGGSSPLGGDGGAQGTSDSNHYLIAQNLYF